MRPAIDFVKANFGPVMTAVTISAVASIWTVFVRPQIVMAGDLQEVKTEVTNVSVKVDKLADTVNSLAISQAEIRVDYLQDRIRELEAQKAGRTLSADETYRLAEYRDRLQQASRLLQQLEK